MRKFDRTLTPSQFTEAERSKFWGRVQRAGDGDCWKWSGRIIPNGYGMLTVRNKDFYAHRIAWELSRETPPGELCVCHTCDVRNCINPGHMFLGTDGDNNADKLAKQRQSWGERRYNTTLTNEIVSVLKRLQARGMKDSELADVFGVSQNVIYKIRKRINWRLVE